MITESNSISSLLQLQEQELEAVYAISRAVAGASDTEAALDEIVHLLRPVFIFDNVVLYTVSENETIEPTFARAIGRGRFREADLAWGEAIAHEVHSNPRVVLRVEELEEGGKIDRTNIRHSLGLPLKLADQVMGALVFIRFGGPEYTTDQIHLVEYVAMHAAQLLQHSHLVEQIANLEAKRRLDSLQDDFVATITHELLTPLGFIKGYATTLLRDDITWEADTQREFLTIIDEEADRLRDLIDNLMDSSRLQAGTLQMTCQPIRLDTLVKEVSQRVRSLHENMNIELEITARRLQVFADPTRLAQVFDNILGNAIKYAPGSPIAITVNKVEDMAHISIRDYGPGIPAEHIEQIFQRFYRIPEHSTSARGTGLGLYICRKIIQAHSGKITAEANLGEGTTFHIYLPCEQEI
jgi:signal transduction histidine kinase